jgi:hypothetical protein
MSNLSKLPDGIYMVWQRSARKGVDHYGVLDIGNQLGIAQADRVTPVVIHQSPPSISLDTVENSGPWYVVGQSGDYEQSRLAFWQACETPDYNLFTNNCEHFARSVVMGRHASSQIQNAVVTGAVVLAIVGLVRNA